jgi:hypothetical protein
VDEHQLALYELIKAKKNKKGGSSNQSGVEDYVTKRKQALQKN